VYLLGKKETTVIRIQIVTQDFNATPVFLPLTNVNTGVNFVVD
jgi:hypothetical protein